MPYLQYVVTRVLVIANVKTTSIWNESTEVIWSIIILKGIKIWNNQKQQNSGFPLCQTYKPTIILN